MGQKMIDERFAELCDQLLQAGSGKAAAVLWLCSHVKPRASNISHLFHHDRAETDNGCMKAIMT